MIRSTLLTLLLAACTGPTDTGAKNDDPDGDGYGSADDCADANPDVYPGAAELCDGQDNDCDGSVDEDAEGGATYYGDGDGDGYGDQTNTVSACDAPTGYVSDNTDCDDSSPSIYPGAAEICDDVDNDCDGTADNNPTNGTTFYADSDGDGYGDADTTTSACDLPNGYATNAYDCDDTSDAVYPGADEVCDELDNDCSGTADDNATDEQVFYADDDGDGYGDTTSIVTACDAPTGYVENDDDCNDSSSAAYPGAAEVCDNIDNDCNGSSDDNADDATLYYQDADSDGYGGSSVYQYACSQPSGYVTTSTDCNDSNAGISPGDAEICDDLDNDCDGVADDSASNMTTWYQDADSDGYGGTTSMAACDQPAGYVATSTDCNDSSASSSPAGTEVCDGVDNDCDGTADDSPTDAITFYADNDGDGYGDPSLTVEDCSLPTGYVSDDSDCDDDDAATHPDADEDCTDSTDRNCDGSVQFEDADGDGVAACEDCDDSNPDRYPGNVEICDDANVDEDCSGAADDADDGATGLLTYYRDVDGDGYTTSTGLSIVQCDAPVGYAAETGDCDDYNSAANPGETEVCDSSNVDEDCDGSADDLDPTIDITSWVTWYGDTDGDGYGSSSRTVQQCDQPTGFVASGGDCDDTNGSRNPGATEACDSSNADEDCDGLSDDADSAPSGRTVWFADSDGDTYGGTTSLAACDQPSGYVSTSTDCNDSSATVNPAAVEICDSLNTDEDCDGLSDDADVASGRSTWYRDNDSDGYGSTTTTTACDQPTGYTNQGGDCNDVVEGINPGEPEVCDSSNVDEDCDGTIDDADTSVTGKSTWYRDADSDSYGTSTTTFAACDQPSGYVSTSTDCNDSNAAIRPGATEVCDGSNTDEDCDGLSDDADTATGGTAWYYDSDGDGYGSDFTTTACDQPSSYVSNTTDCDDSSGSVNPAATEVCDSGNVDEDCDGTADDSDSSVTNKNTWYRDNDSDGYGVTAYTTTACDQPSGYVATSGDCNDALSTISPGRTEVCDSSNVDEDCDGTADDSDSSVTGKTTWYRDADSDTYGTSSTSTSACDQPSGYVTTSTDCNDSSATVRPGGTEVCDSSNVDEDCDGTADDSDTSVSGKTTWYYDADADGYGGATTVTSCDQPSSYVATGGDCDDANPVVYALQTWYRDIDGDNYGVSTTTVSSCTRPTGYVASAGDCNDANATYNPGATETCDASNIDEDCDGLADNNDTYAAGSSLYYVDADLDGYGDADLAQYLCDVSSGYSTNDDDCDDSAAGTNPGATEVCDASNTDEDCDGDADDADDSATGKSTYYIDSDADGYGDASEWTQLCDTTTAYIDDNTDCNDADATISPGATEDCDNDIDEDCDGSDLSCSWSGTVVAEDNYNTKIYANTSSSATYFGYSLAAGDFNNDGEGDLAVGSPYWTQSYQRGMVHVFSGPIASGTKLVSATTTLVSYYPYNYTTSSSSYPYDYELGGRVLTVPRINGSGADELAIYYNYKYGSSSTQYYSNCSYLMYGGDSGSGLVVSSYDDAVNCGSASINDWDSNEGYLLYGNYAYSSYAGVVYGPGTYVGSSAEYAGYSVGGNADLNGDGYEDVAAGAPYYGSSDTGVVHIVYGITTGTFYLTYSDADIFGASTSERIGTEVNGVSDMDGDGYDDLLVGDSSSNLYFISGGDISGTVTASTTAYAKISGSSIALNYNLGDINGDGDTDILTGSTSSNAAYLMYGPFSGTISVTADKDATFTGQNSGDGFGEIAIIPDFDADGDDEIAIGAYSGDERGYLNVGTVYVFLGGL